MYSAILKSDVRTVLFWIGAAILVIAGFAVTLVLAIVTWPFDRDRRFLHLWTGALARIFLRWRVEGREKIPTRGAVVLVANHRSLLDIPAMYGLHRHFKWVSKSSLFRIPFLGWWMRLCRYISLTRGDPASVVKMYRACERWLDRGVPVFLFPEGTWSPEGGLRPFKEGAFNLAVVKRCPVIPIAVSDRTIRVLDPIFPDHDPAELRDRVHDAIEASLC